MRASDLLESTLVATTSEWIAGARPRTLPAAIAPVIVGTGVAAYDGMGRASGVVWWKAALALIVAIALQVGVNYANDYSDGIRGTDDDRVGPMRLVGSGRATPAAVLVATCLALGTAAAAGLALAATTTWWLLAIGAASIIAAWFYTGGQRPYGYVALGELMVFIFFGLVATVGTTYVQIERTPEAAWYAGIGVGALACAILVVNNLRDIPSDREAGKRTLAVVLGEDRTRGLYALLVLAATAAVVAVASVTRGGAWWASPSSRRPHAPCASCCPPRAEDNSSRCCNRPVSLNLSGPFWSDGPSSFPSGS
jgi:1,4-dihydroxy-2-naphthoate polyprenyltransferase